MGGNEGREEGGREGGKEGEKGGQREEGRREGGRGNFVSKQVGVFCWIVFELKGSPYLKRRDC